jgi:uncharacterized protein YbjT (DUF2867 family)
MHVFITGTTGYIGGSVAAWLVRHGVKVSGLVRTEARATELTGLGIRPVLGELYDADVLRSACSDADVVINAASADNPYPVATFCKRLLELANASSIPAVEHRRRSRLRGTERCSL